MNELILKIRHWLIEKLGGYTKQHIDNRTTVMKTHKLHPIKLVTEMSVGYYTLAGEISDPYLIQRFKEDMAFQIAAQLVKEDLLLIESREDYYHGQRKYRAELNIIHPHDVAMCRQ